ncbi:MAG: sporulation membrane protein YtaF [Syntrophomonadaceae bacterium]|nr:sporulation membrane protein YtaF [Syntrophomonadaceae bacterium]MDD3889966.1 sporulation membrane protein YtaF [Syntrophomonadaceae bacterium]MDD4549379.1 sporulation membrane protein YtaF [Syntrophomonadaceae bacterium]
MELITVLLFALAVSSDGFVAGVQYGIHKIRIPLFSLLVISLASACAVTISMTFGKGLASVLPDNAASTAGALILCSIGAYFLLRAFKEKIKNLETSPEEPLLTLNLKSLGIIIHILKKPASADMDSSGELSAREAFFLGFALALDALGAGIGLAMTGFNILLTAIAVGMLKFILISSGIYIGTVIKHKRLQSISSIIPGIIFILIGLSELL